MPEKTHIRTLFPLLLLFLFSCVDQEEKNQTVTIEGKLINWGNASKLLNSEANEGDFGLGRDFILTTDDQGIFKVSFELEEGTYYSLGRNKLFLEPGDQIYMEVDYKDPEAGLFEGDGAERQTYLSGVAFPKSGSYLSGGRFVKSPEIEPIIELATEKTDERRAMLTSLTEETQEFLRLEEMRLKLDYINTILSFPIYGSFKEYWEYSEDKRVEVLLGAKEELNKASQDIMKNEHMKHPNFRDMLLTFSESRFREVGIFLSLELTPLMKAYDQMGAFVTELELSGLTQEMQRKASEFMQSGISQTYLEMAQRKMDEYEVLKLGKPAFDVEFKTPEDAPVALSEFKGKLIYVDLWATWCGPCIDELPAFEKLREDYADKDVTFLPVSIDTDLERWRAYLEKHNMTENEMIINRLDLADYKVITIPRYLLIDKDFKIISVFAPKPSLQETRDLIDEYL